MWQLVPNNPGRFYPYACILASEGFDSRTHFWDVEVGDNLLWIIGITPGSIERKGKVSYDTNVWCVSYKDGKYFSQSPEKPNNLITVKEKLQIVRLELDWDRGKLSFCDPLTNKHLHTLTAIFTESLSIVSIVFHSECNIE